MKHEQSLSAIYLLRSHLINSWIYCDFKIPMKTHQMFLLISAVSEAVAVIGIHCVVILCRETKKKIEFLELSNVIELGFHRVCILKSDVIKSVQCQSLALLSSITNKS